MSDTLNVTTLSYLPASPSKSHIPACHYTNTNMKWRNTEINTSIWNLVTTLNRQWQLRLTLQCCLVAEGQLFPAAHEPVSQSTEVSLERNCAIYQYSSSKSTLWGWTLFHSEYITDWHVARTGRQEMCTEFWKGHVVETIYIRGLNSMDKWEVDQDCIKWWPLVVAVLQFPLLPQYIY